MAEHSILESRVSELQSLLSDTQSELSSLKDNNQGLVNQLATRESQIKAVSLNESKLPSLVLKARDLSAFD